MQGNKAKDTQPELAIRRAAFALGLRYRVGIRPIAAYRRTADFVFPKARVAVFVDGCFWHGCPVHGVRPREHAEYWGMKLDRNRVRDVETTYLLETAGWVVLRFWEHEDPEIAALSIREIVESRRT